MSLPARAFGVITILSILACGGTTPTPTETPVPPAPVAEPAATPAADPGKIGTLDFPAVATTAVSGQFVMAPSREFYDSAVKDGADKATFIWYGATMIAPGATESKVKSLAGTEFSLPNSLILPIGRGATAAKGDVVLTQWQSGSGLQRAIVTGGTPTAPVVRYLDMDWDNPSGIAQKDDTLVPDHFAQVQRGAVGSTIACKQDGGFRHGVMVALDGGRALQLGFAGKLAAYPTSDCVALEPRPAVKVGAAVWVPNLGSYTQGTVTRVDAALGRVWTKISFGGQDKEIAVAWSDTALALDALGEGFGAPVVAATPPAPAPVEETHRVVPDRPHPGALVNPGQGTNRPIRDGRAPGVKGDNRGDSTTTKPSGTGGTKSGTGGGKKDGGKKDPAGGGKNR